MELADTMQDPRERPDDLQFQRFVEAVRKIHGSHSRLSRVFETAFSKILRSNGRGARAATPDPERKVGEASQPPTPGGGG
jgi:hypothetical protein